MAFKSKSGKNYHNRQQMKAADERESPKEKKAEAKEPEMEAKESPAKEMAEGGGGDMMTCPHCGAQIEVGHTAKPAHESAPPMHGGGMMGSIPGM